MKKFFCLLAILFFSLLLNSCDGKTVTPASSAPPRPTAAPSKPDALIGISFPNKSSERWVSDGQNLVKIFTEMGYRTDLRFTNNDYDEDTQKVQVEDMINKGVNAIILAAVGSDGFGGYGLKDLLMKAKKSGVYVFAYDRRMVHNMPYVDYFIGFDKFQAGVIQGSQIETALDLKNGKGPYHFEMFGDENSCSDSTFSGAMSVLTPYIEKGQLIVRSGQKNCNAISITGGSDLFAQDRMDKILKSFYTTSRVDAILSTKDSLSRGVIASLQKAKYGTAVLPWPAITGQDADVASIKQMINGTQAFTVFNDPRKLASQAAAMVDAALKGQAVPNNDTKTYSVRVSQPYTMCLKELKSNQTISCSTYDGEHNVPAFFIPPTAVDVKNYEQVLVSSGFYSSSQLK